ncbi:PHP domain-containing protein [Candidatus Daviesbacteria bacterium]|nr:PHP domain-containing protein [Candidatus Daviesbacteria bacterium]
MEISNSRIAKILRDVAASYIIKNIGNIFQVRAYENAADSVEHSTTEVQDLWEEGRLEEIPALGEKIRSYLDELFKTGKVSHFAEIKKDIPEVVFELLDIPGIGPKLAQKIADLGIKSIEDLEIQIKTGSLVQKGFSAKLAQNIMEGLREVKNRGKRMLLPYAFVQAEKVVAYLKQSQDVIDVHPLGSLRRMVATVGDLDFSVSSNNNEKVVDYFCKMPGVSRVLDKGSYKATVALKSGIQLDLLVGEPNSYGALLQHFTGSKSHNIKLRELANQMGYSLSEYGVKRVEDGKIIQTKTEDEFYKLLGMRTPLPEIREDTGEIEAALRQAQGKLPGLPKLVESKNIKGDLHLHSNFPIKSPSHGPGGDTIEDIVKKARALNYEFVGIADHSPGFSTNSPQEIIKWVKERTNFIRELQKRTKSIRILNGLEIDILGNGSLSIPDEALVYLDYCIAGIHSGHRGTKEIITKRLLNALNNPYVDIVSHPTNRLLNERDSSDADWPQIFQAAAKNNKLLEINAFPNRLDLRDDLVRLALKSGVKLVVNTDAHQIEQMGNMLFGVAQARRGWATAKDIVNTWDWKNFAKWFNM